MVKLQRTDLHLHTIYSDGELRPKDVILACKKAGKGAVAITDHDTTKGTSEAIRAAKKCGIKILLPANAEFTSVYQNKTEHILGYHLNLENKRLNEYFTLQEKRVKDYVKRVVNELTQFGFEISLAQILNCSHGMIGDFHIYQAVSQNTKKQKNSKNAHILKKNKIKTSKSFNKIFLKGMIRFEKEKLSSKDIIKIILGSGGYAVLAHPFWKKDTTIYNIQGKIEYLQKMGLNGLEVFYPRHSQAQTLKLYKIAEELDLYKTIGSDFHRPGEFRKIGYIHTYGLKANFLLPL